MALHRKFTDVAKSWDQVLTLLPGKDFTFEVLGVSPAGDQVRIRNDDDTHTVLIGAGLKLARTEGGKARIADGTIEDMERVGGDGSVIEAVTGLNVAVASDPGAMGRMREALSRSKTPDLSGASGESHAGLAAPGPAGLRGHTGRNGSKLKVLALLAPVLFVVLGAMWLTTDPAETDRARLRWQFARPSSIPNPPDNVLSAARVELGRSLFNDKRLSANGAVACATCHVPKLGFTDGVPFGQGVGKSRLKMHTPTLWNIAWANAFFWDGRASTLEEQALGPIEHPDEMGSTRAAAVQYLKSRPDYVGAFANAFPEQPEISDQTLAKALASYQRTIVSPPTRFDRWLDGNSTALNASEKNGFRIFVGKGGCVNCHSGWSFTDHAFHDIGLNTNAIGRGRVIKRAALEKAFKTPTLREAVWSAPYMHDGSMATLEQVVAHYESGGIDRDSRSPDMPRRLVLSERERGELVAFLKTLSSDRPPQPASAVASAPTTSVQSVVDLPKVGQKGKKFSMERLRIRAGQSVAISNDDNQPHNVFIQDPRMTYDSGSQNPGEQVNVPFPQAGDFDVFCGIHPSMRLRVEVEPSIR